MDNIKHRVRLRSEIAFQHNQLLDNKNRPDFTPEDEQELSLVDALYSYMCDKDATIIVEDRYFEDYAVNIVLARYNLPDSIVIDRAASLKNIQKEYHLFTMFGKTYWVR